jgi:hypothetical protein
MPNGDHNEFSHVVKLSKLETTARNIQLNADEARVGLMRRFDLLRLVAESGNIARTIPKRGRNRSFTAILAQFALLRMIRSAKIGEAVISVSSEPVAGGEVGRFPDLGRRLRPDVPMARRSISAAVTQSQALRWVPHIRAAQKPKYSGGRCEKRRDVVPERAGWPQGLVGQKNDLGALCLMWRFAGSSTPCLFLRWPSGVAGTGFPWHLTVFGAALGLGAAIFYSQFTAALICIPQAGFSTASMAQCAAERPDRNLAAISADMRLHILHRSPVAFGLIDSANALPAVASFTLSAVSFLAFAAMSAVYR